MLWLLQLLLRHVACADSSATAAAISAPAATSCGTSVNSWERLSAWERCCSYGSLYVLFRLLLQRVVALLASYAAKGGYCVSLGKLRQLPLQRRSYGR